MVRNHLVSRSSELLCVGQYGAAQRILDMDPEGCAQDPRAALLAARIQAHKFLDERAPDGDVRSAREALRSAIKDAGLSAEDRAEGLKSLARVEGAINDRAAEVQTLEELCALQPQGVYNPMILGNAYRMTQRFEEAWSCYETAWSEVKTQESTDRQALTTLLLNMADLAVSQGSDRAKVGVALDRLAEHDRIAAAHFRGQDHFRRGEWGAAIEAYNGAIRDSRQGATTAIPEPHIVCGLALALRHAGKPEEALTTLEQAMVSARAPQTVISPRVTLERAICHAVMGQVGRAAELLDVLAHDTESPPSLAATYREYVRNEPAFQRLRQEGTMPAVFV